jgi:hypothetical protein
MTANQRPASVVPALVTFACLPLSVIKVLTYAALLVYRADPQGGALFGFAVTFGFLVVFYPALLLFEPFAVIATIWYTRHCPFDEPVGRVLVCWAAVAVHTIILVSYLRTWHR